MEYISAIEASEKWGVSLRQVQRILADNRIPHAKRYGRTWMIPEDAKKPIDPRREKKLSPNSFSSDMSYTIASTTIPLPDNNPGSSVDTEDVERLQFQNECELAYLRGEFKQAMSCFLNTEGDDAARLHACPIAIAAAISMGNYDAYIEMDTYLKRCLKADKGSEVSAMAELALATAAVSVLAPEMAPDWLKEGDFSAYAEQLRPFALYLRAKYFQCVGRYEAMLAVAQTTLSLYPVQQEITLTEIYLRLACATACYTLERWDEARRWLMETMTVALPHGFITPFAEVVTALGGLVEQCLNQSFPEYFDAIIGQCNLTWKNWITFHNLFAKDNITLLLSVREYHLALLVAHRVPYSKIAKQNAISVGRLKNIIQEIYGKLFISSRDELSQYLF